MIVGQDHVLHIGQVDLQVTRVFQDGVGMASGVEQHAVTIRNHQCRESPLSDSRGLAHQHRRKHRDFERVNLGGGGVCRTSSALLRGPPGIG
jgi:hypothetical protein